ncbi:MAG TPA: PolC-type DNA polymerase III [Bacillales bacterium]|nr:PolC-type DNA polymerase III [Bacillales bacterium]
MEREGLEKTKKFQVLLEQLEVPAELIERHFQGAALEKLIVDTNERGWHFCFSLPAPLPYNVHEWMKARLEEKFANIASVSFSVQAQKCVIDEKMLADYWPHCVEALSGLSESLSAVLKNQQPRFADGKLRLEARNETEAVVFKKKLADRIAGAYETFGISGLKIAFQVQESEKDYEKFLEQKQEEDRTKVTEAVIQKEKAVQKKTADVTGADGPVAVGYTIKDAPVQIQTITEEERKITVQGYVFEAETRELRSGRLLLTVKLTDYSDSLMVKMFSRKDEDIPKMKAVKQGIWLKARGSIQHDTFVRDLVMIANDLQEVPSVVRTDDAPEGEKRVELHMHTPMSQMDAVTSTARLVEQAAKWGHEAVAITDHGVVQSYPEAYAAGNKHGIKVLYGLEANLVDDGVPIAYNGAHRKLLGETYVVFDVETTGLSAVYDKIIELAAVKVKNGEIIDRFERFANPHHALSQTTIELTGITDDMVENAPEIEEVLRDFHAFTGDDVLVAHNASFDMGFLNVGYKQIGYGKAKNPVVDTLELGRFLYTDLKNHRLDTLCKKFNIELTQHHRAIYDAEATGHLVWKMVLDAKEQGIIFHDQLNEKRGKGEFRRVRPMHCTLLAQTQQGLRNLYKLVSIAHLDYFHRVPRIPRSELEKYREGLLVGSGCSEGELFTAVMQKSLDEAEEVAEFYDYIEVHPPVVYERLIETDLIHNENALRDILKKLVQLGEKLDKPVVATGNVHYLDPNDHIYRKILVASQGGANPLNRLNRLPQVHFRTTTEMLEAFAFLGEEKAKEIVVTNPQQIANSIGEVKPVKDDLYTPNIEGADEEVRRKSFERARSIYGDPLPKLVEQRLEKELESIIGNGFAVIYLISHKLVKKSLEDGYLVGSRGSVGSSFTATMLEITEVNPLPPHYVCPECKHSEFIEDGSIGSGFDLRDADCPKCGAHYVKNGHDIPFETFLGFKGDKVPDIDLNFSGEYQPRAHNYTKELFGEDKVYRAGTIGTVANKTAYGFVRGYENDNGFHFRSAEIDRLTAGCTGVKRTTGQHPGGIIVVPDDMDIYDFTPIQYPADDRNSEWRTTHFDFHSIHDNLLKLDILGHDDPTMIRMLQDLSGIDPKTIPTDDEGVMSLFSGTESIGVTEDQIMCKTGTLGIPEFGTRFVRQMLEETKPSTFSELVQISGLSHGTDVWLNNASDLIADGTCELKDVIGCRDDIMVYLMYKGLEPSLAFKIMEFVRKGRGLQDEWIEAMKANGVPDWYIESCKKIKYMFPKAHAAAYVLMAVRIAYFKVHHPIWFYAAYFTVRAGDFDLATMVRGSSAIRSKIEDIQKKGLDASPKEKSLLTVLELALEMCERGMSFQKVDLYRSQAAEFIVEGDTLIPPFNAIAGLGTNAALNIVKAREDGEFLSKEDLQQRARLSKTVVEDLDGHGCLQNMPDSNQLSLF